MKNRLAHRIRNFAARLPLFALLLAPSAFAPASALAATILYTDIAAPSFAGRNSSFHNDGQAPDACAAQVPLDIGEENRGDLQNAAGSFIANVVLPQGSTITKFTLFANDADADINSTAYLMRKRIVNNLNPAKSGIVTMAQASTAGAVTDTLRAFSTTAITGPTVANGANQYFVELVNCGKTVEPFSVQITTSVP
jgi:hypothetical protein